MSRRITVSNYEKIKSLVAPQQIREQDRRRDELKELSDKRVSRWPNTLQAQRRKKETAFLERKAKREEEQLKIDREETEKLARERKDKIDYASKTIYRATDKMKRLQSAEILVECISGRNKQVDLNLKIKSAESKWEEQFLKMDEERLKRMEAREKEEIEERLQMAKIVAKVQKEQLEGVKGAYRARLESLKAEGEAIAAKAREEQLEEQQELKNRKVRARQTAAEITRANEELKAIRAQQKKLEEEEDLKTKMYAQKQVDLEARQKKQASRIEAMKQKKRQEMIDEGVRRLQQFIQNDDKRIENQVAEARAAEDNRNRIRDEKRRAFAETIRQSRLRQTQRRTQEREDRLRFEREFAEKWREHNLEIENQEMEEKKAELRAAKDHQEYLRIQMHEKTLRDHGDRTNDFNTARHLQQNVRDEEDEFLRIAMEKVEALKAQGKDPYPLLKCIKDVKNEKLLAAV